MLSFVLIAPTYDAARQDLRCTEGLEWEYYKTEMQAECTVTAVGVLRMHVRWWVQVAKCCYDGSQNGSQFKYMRGSARSFRLAAYCLICRASVQQS